jgi:hypothetical protein
MPASSLRTCSGTPASTASPRKDFPGRRLPPSQKIAEETNETDDEITLKKSPVRSIPIEFFFDPETKYLQGLDQTRKGCPLSGSLYFVHPFNPYNFRTALRDCTKM